MKHPVRASAVATTAAVAAAVLLGATGAAHADAPPTGAEACPSGSICLYYNSPNLGWGSFEHWSPGAYGDLSRFRFGTWGNGSGYGRSAGGHAASAVDNTGARNTAPSPHRLLRLLRPARPSEGTHS